MSVFKGRNYTLLRNNMTTTVKNFIGIIIALAVFASLAIWAGTSKNAYGSAPSGLATSQEVATTTTVGPQQNITLFAALQGCNSRVIGTVSQPIMILFADPTNGDLSSTTLSGSKGFWQSASTTVAYDSGIYGCGRVIGYAYASTTVTRAEFK